MARLTIDLLHIPTSSWVRLQISTTGARAGADPPTPLWLGLAVFCTHGECPVRLPDAAFPVICRLRARPGSVSWRSLGCPGWRTVVRVPEATRASLPRVRLSSAGCATISLDFPTVFRVGATVFPLHNQYQSTCFAPTRGRAIVGGSATRLSLWSLNVEEANHEPGGAPANDCRGVRRDAFLSLTVC